MNLKQENWEEICLNKIKSIRDDNIALDILSFLTSCFLPLSTPLSWNGVAYASCITNEMVIGLFAIIYLIYSYNGIRKREVKMDSILRFAIAIGILIFIVFVVNGGLFMKSG